VEPVIWAEVTARRGQVLERVRVDRLPFTIGRSYRNDLVLGDRTVSAHHAVVDRDAEGALVLTDRASENGTFADGSRERVEQIPLAAGRQVRLGAVVLHFRFADDEVAPTLPLRPRHPILEWTLTHWSAALVGGLAITAASFWEDWRSAVVSLDPAQQAQELLGGLLVVALWAGGWAFVGRLLVHAARFVGHWAAACAFALGLVVSNLAILYARFLFAPITALQRADAAMDAALIGGLLWMHLRLATALRASRRVAVALLAASLWFGYQELDLHQDRTNWVQTLPYWSRLQPIPPAWLAAEPVDVFFERSRAMTTELEEIARELSEQDEQRRLQKGEPG
jgi:hypothetical protein